jgi:hypothetical protein
MKRLSVRTRPQIASAEPPMMASHGRGPGTASA